MIQCDNVECDSNIATLPGQVPASWITLTYTHGKNMEQVTETLHFCGWGCLLEWVKGEGYEIAGKGGTG
jgi:hypothetical protein